MSKPKARRVDFYPDEFIAGVGGVLRADEQGVYWMICSLIMSEGGPIEQNDRRLAGLCSIRPADIKKIVETLVAKGKVLRQDDGKLLQKRSQSEVEKSLKRIQSASENGSNRGRTAWKTKENQQKHETPGSFAEKLTTNHQPPTTNLEEKEEPIGSSKKRAFRLPDDWQPDRSFGEAEGLTAADIDREAEKFRDHWRQQPGQKGVKLDWTAAWRNWTRKAADDRRSRKGPQGRGPGRTDDLNNDFLFGGGR